MVNFKLFIFLKFFVINTVHANLLLDGTITDQETYPADCLPIYAGDGILSGSKFYHAHGSQVNNWLDFKTATDVTVNTILFLSGD